MAKQRKFLDYINCIIVVNQVGTTKSGWLVIDSSEDLQMQSSVNTNTRKYRDSDIISFSDFNPFNFFRLCQQICAISLSISSDWTLSRQSALMTKNSTEIKGAKKCKHKRINIVTPARLKKLIMLQEHPHRLAFLQIEIKQQKRMPIHLPRRIVNHKGS